MTRFAGVIGYGDQQEAPPSSGIFKDVIIERKLRGEVLRNTKQSTEGSFLNNDITVSSSISVVADEYATRNYFNIRYAVMNGVRWTVSNVDPQHPRIILTLGKVYNGPTPS